MKKRYIIIFIVVIFAIINIGALIYIVNENNTIVYAKKYVATSDDSWVEFFSDGTCFRNIKLDYCKYKVDGDLIILKQKQTDENLGLSMKMELHFKIIGSDNLEHIHTCFPDYNDAHSDFNCDSDENNLEKLGQTVKYSLKS